MRVEYKEITEKIFIISVISLFCIKIFKRHAEYGI